MDRDGDGRVDSEEVALAMIDAVEDFSKAKHRAKYMKYGIVALAGLVLLLATSGVISSYAVAKLTQELKVSSDGVLVGSRGGDFVKTIPQGVTVGSPGSNVGAQRRGLEGTSEEEIEVESYACLTGQDVDELYTTSFTNPVSVPFSGNVTHGIQTHIWNGTDFGFVIVTPTGDHYVGEYDEEGLICSSDDVTGGRKLKEGEVMNEGRRLGSKYLRSSSRYYLSYTYHTVGGITYRVGIP